MPIRWPWRRRDPDPGTPHAFRDIDDIGLAAIAAGGSQWDQASGSLAQVKTTDNFIRKSRCGVPGCGRERSDPIHQTDAG
jgi:hypothetical protein